MDEAYDRLYDGKSFKVYHDGGFLFRYTVTEPNGRVLTSTTTRWGARWAIHRAKQRAIKRAWWEAPIVDEVQP